jgi:ABC-type transport system substrate-binding protein
MPVPRRILALSLVAVVAVTGCGQPPQGTPTPSTPTTVASPTPPLVDVPFTPSAWPATGSACDIVGYAGRMGRVEALDARTVRFTLCASDGAFLARLAHPSLGIVDAAALARLAADPATARDVAGRGAYQVVEWGADDVVLGRVGAASAGATAPTVILRWAADPAARGAALQAATVDGIDAPAAAALDGISTQPELTLVPRPALATAFLGFGRDAAFATAGVRRAIAGGIDRTALVSAALPAGSDPADHLAPCAVAAGCAGAAFPAFNAPASSAALKAAGFPLGTTWPLHVPDAPVPGLPDPAGTAAAVQAQLTANLGLRTTVDVMPAAAFRQQVDAGTLAGLYLDGVATEVADASAFFEPLFVTAADSTAASRGAGIPALLAAASSTTEPAAREAALGRASTALSAAAPIVPLAHPGGETVFRTDVTGVAVSPYGADPLGAATAADRGQVVFMQASAPPGGWCGNQPSQDAYRLCGLETEGLYTFAPGTLIPIPGLATACQPSAEALVWTCRLREARTAGGLELDAGDVLATFRAMWDASSPQHAAAPGAFGAWTALFGAFAGTPGS